MSAAASLAELLAERHRRQVARDAEEAAKRAEAQKGAANDNRVADLCMGLRAHYHPQQRAFFDRTAVLRKALWRGAALCTRRAGKTAGGTREVLARCLEQPGYRAIYCGQTREEARARAWESDTRDGWLDLLEDLGEPIEKSKTVAFIIAGIRANVNRQTLTIDFSNKSQIVVFAANHKKDQRKLRGRAKWLVWVDEAQEFLELTNFVENVCSALVKDFKGEVWLTGTPSEDCSGYFYEVTCEPESGDTPRPGWEVQRWDVTDNPYFGRTVARTVALDDGAYDVVDQFNAIISTHETIDEAERAASQLRWDATAGAALIENGWKGDEPQFLREYKRRWVKTDAWFTYAVHAVHESKLHWITPRGIIAPMRLDVDGWLDYEAALDDLPRKPNGRRYNWLVGAGADFGMNPHPMALSSWSFCMELPGIWELFSWKKTGLVPDDQLEVLWRFVRQVSNLMVLVGDPGGQKIGDLIAWKERSGLPIEPADKAHKRTWQEMLNGAIRTGLARFRKGSPMLHEMRHLMNKKGPTGKVIELDERKLPSGEVPGNDCSDGGLYSFRHIHMFRGEEPKPPLADPAARLAAEGAALEKQVDAAYSAPKRDEGWASIDDYEGSGGWQ